MVLKTFNVRKETYKKFSGFCKENGINMSKQIDLFIEAFLEDDPVAKKGYLTNLDKIKKGKFV